MVVTPYQIAVPILSFIAILYAWSLVTRKKKTVWGALLWTIFWGALAVLAFAPSLLTYLAWFTGIKDSENAVIFTALGIIFFMVFYMVMRMEELEQRQTRVIRKIGLRRFEEEMEKHRVSEYPNIRE